MGIDKNSHWNVGMLPSGIVVPRKSGNNHSLWKMVFLGNRRGNGPTWFIVCLDPHGISGIEYLLYALPCPLFIATYNLSRNMHNPLYCHGFSGSGTWFTLYIPQIFTFSGGDDDALCWQTFGHGWISSQFYPIYSIKLIRISLFFCHFLIFKRSKFVRQIFFRPLRHQFSAAADDTSPPKQLGPICFGFVLYFTLYSPHFPTD